MIHFSDYLQRAAEAADFLRGRGMGPVDIVVQCGSGLAGIADDLLPEGQRIELNLIPHMPRTTVTGHGNEAVQGRLRDKSLLLLTGRFHVFEGHDPATAGFPAAVAAALGAQLFVCTNAAGALNEDMQVGDAMLHHSYINFQGDNAAGCLTYSEPAQRFVNPNPTYDPEASRALGLALAKAGLRVQRGTYLAVRGPLFETEAELRMMRAWGADAVGMSTVPEVTVCHLVKLPVAAVSVLTNDCFDSEQTDHGRVLAISRQAAGGIALALKCLIGEDL